MTVPQINVITTVHVLISLVTTAVAVGHVGLGDIATLSLGLYVMLRSVKITESAKILSTRTIIHAPVNEGLQDRTATLCWIPVIALHVKMVEIAPS